MRSGRRILSRVFPPGEISTTTTRPSGSRYIRVCSRTVLPSGCETMIPNPLETSASTCPARSVISVEVFAPANSRRIHSRSSTVIVACDAISCAKNRYAAAVGTRPAEVCGWYSKPPSSRSAITLRIVAVLNISSNRLEIAREDTGSPVSMYVRTISARIWRFRRSCSAGVLIPALYSVCPLMTNHSTADAIYALARLARRFVRCFVRRRVLPFRKFRFFRHIRRALELHFVIVWVDKRDHPQPIPNERFASVRASRRSRAINRQRIFAHKTDRHANGEFFRPAIFLQHQRRATKLHPAPAQLPFVDPLFGLLKTKSRDIETQRLGH